MLPKSLEGMFGVSGMVLACCFFVLGCISLRRDQRAILLGILIAPALFTLAASALQKYPFSDRLILFLYPLDDATKTRLDEEIDKKSLAPFRYELR